MAIAGNFFIISWNGPNDEEEGGEQEKDDEGKNDADDGSDDGKCGLTIK